MLVVGITGGSGTGKTTVSQAFKSLGGISIDADAVYHELLEECTVMRREILERFPEARCDKSRIDRRQLARIVFADASALDELNRITHHYVIDEIERRVGDSYRCNAPIVLIDAVALFESGANELCDVTVGVIAPRELRIHRIMVRDGLDFERAAARIDAQPEDSYYLNKCNYVIDTGCGVPAEDAARQLYTKIMEGMEIPNE